MAQVKVISDYRRGELHYDKGQVLDISPAYALHLLNDAPGCFEMVVERPELPDAPPVDRAIKKSPRRKNS